ncbi:hypothetical protein [Quadrisphaera setariae]|uniref:Uncharacterized protein n=1 Tax=Quadrisphaera setariae TaxID=2593304 RepID=A0A5C8Z5P2_9ACTN|nr:hypothetical protein [Quadrisphaera setariae]TXR52240.1 hypothetical protein FMM08_20795 [Quadrisphaera setariae]
MSREGPALAALTARLAAAPRDALDPGVVALAVVDDALTALGGPPLDGALRRRLASGPLGSAEGRTGAVLASWLVLSPAWRAAQPDPRAALAVVEALAGSLAPVLPPAQWVGDPAGREEAARAALRAAGMRPAGEDDAVAEDRWTAVSSALRASAMAEVAQEVRRAQELARALAERRAREAAAQYTHV